MAFLRDQITRGPNVARILEYIGTSDVYSNDNALLKYAPLMVLRATKNQLIGYPAEKAQM